MTRGLAAQDVKQNTGDKIHVSVLRFTFCLLCLRGYYTILSIKLLYVRFMSGEKISYS